MHRALVLTKYPDEYQRLIEAEQLPDLEVVATSDVADGLARAGDSGIVLGDPARVVQALPHLTRIAMGAAVVGRRGADARSRA